MSEYKYEGAELPEAPSPKLQLTQLGKIILAISLIISITFITIGIVVAVKNSKDDEHVPAGTQYESLYLNSTKNVYADRYSYKTYSFTPSQSGYYTINLEGLQLTNVETRYGSSVEYESVYNSYYDYSYEVYLSGGATYTIEVYKNTSYSTSSYILIER